MISLDSNPVPDCMKALGNLPQKMSNFVGASINNAGQCVTTEYDNNHNTPNTPCVFPWKHGSTGDTVYNGCANPDEDSYGSWCPTDLTRELSYVMSGEDVRRSDC